MTTSPDLLAIVNPLSGTYSVARKEQLRSALAQVATDAGFRANVVLTERPGHATDLATEAVRAGITRVLAVGGDGTISETARALRRSGTALGIVPMGSGNGLARHLGLPMEPLRAVKRALAGKPVLIDSGELNGHPFFCTAGLGFEALVAHEFANLTVRGLRSYVQTAYRTFWDYQPGRYVVNGEEKELFSLTFANAGQFGNNAWIAPTANIADGQLDLCELLPFPKVSGVQVAYQLFNKTLHGSAYWHGESVTCATVQAETPLLIHADGEPITLTTDELHVRVLPSSLLVLL